MYVFGINMPVLEILVVLMIIMMIVLGVILWKVVKLEKQ